MIARPKVACHAQLYSKSSEEAVCCCFPPGRGKGSRCSDVMLPFTHRTALHSTCAARPCQLGTLVLNTALTLIAATLGQCSAVATCLSWSHLAPVACLMCRLVAVQLGLFE